MDKPTRQVSNYTKNHRALNMPDVPHPLEFGVGLPAKHMGRNELTFGAYDDEIPVAAPPRKVLIPIRRY